MRLKKSAHTVYRAQYRIVWITPFRKKILVKEVRQYLRVKLLEVRKYYPDWEYIKIGIDCDHIHLHMVIPPKYSVSEAVEIIKKNASRALREKFSFLNKVYWDNKGVWGKVILNPEVGINEEIIRKYVEIQGKEDAGQAELEL